MCRDIWRPFSLDCMFWKGFLLHCRLCLNVFIASSWDSKEMRVQELFHEVEDGGQLVRDCKPSPKNHPTAVGCSTF